MVNADLLKTIVLQHNTINGRYSSPEVLSEDGVFSVVFRARRTQDDRRVVLKFFVNATGDPYRRIAFDREGAVLSGVLKGEDRFVQLVDPPSELRATLQFTQGSATGSFEVQLPFLVFEWMNGGNAEDLAATPIQTASDVLGRLVCFREMTRAVTRLHNLDCFHRDLKPGNFLFENTPAQQNVKLSDFGTIRFAQGGGPILPAYTAPVGDRRYAAPELFSGVDVPHAWYRAADTYSLGAILFELLTNQQLIAFLFRPTGSASQFSQHMLAVPEAGRLSVFHAFLDAQRNAAPKLRAICPLIPRCVAGRLDELLASLTAFDYRQRTTDLPQVVRLIDICRLILSNEIRQQSRLRQRRATASTP